MKAKRGEKAAASVKRRGPGRPRARSIEEGRKLVVRAACRVFAERGLEATIDAIAREAEVPRATVYELFTDKDALLAATVDDAADRMFRCLARGFTAPDDWPWQQVIHEAFVATFQFVKENPDTVTLLLLAERSSALPRSSGMSGARQRVLAALAEQSLRRWELLGAPIGRSAEVVASMIYGMAENVALRHVEKHWDPEVLIDLLTAFTTGGLVALWNGELRHLRALDA